MAKSTKKQVEDLTKYLSKTGTFGKDYAALREAVCNLERIVLDGRAATPGKRFGDGTGGAADPPNPPPPPSFT